MNNRIAIRNFLTRVSLILIFVSALATGTLGQAVLVSDAHTSITSGNGNFGTNPALVVSANNTTYMKFKIARTLPSGTTADDVGRATVKFYINKVTTPGKLDVFPITAAWDEKTITANNAPALGALALTTQQINKDAQGNYFLIDITDMVKQWRGDGTGQNAVPNYGFALAPHPLDADTPQLAELNLDSKEASQTSHDASLNVQLNSDSGLTTVAHDGSLIGDGTTNNLLGVAPGAITDTYLADGAVTTDKLANGSVVASKLADGAVAANKIADGAVANSNIADGAVSVTKIADGAVVASKIADNAVGTTELADASVTSAKIAAPLSLTGNSANSTLTVVNAGSGPALSAQGAINSSTQYNIAGQRILANPGSRNLFAGANSGLVNTGIDNAFFGSFTGSANTTGQYNSFFGADAGRLNVDGFGNSFFGMFAGRSNTSGDTNSFFGMFAGVQNTTADSNTFVGYSSGSGNIDGHSNAYFGANTGVSTNASLNSFFGDSAGNNVTTGSGNTFLGWSAGGNTSTGSDNTFVGAASAFNALFATGTRNTLLGAFTKAKSDISFATAIGFGALVTQSNSLVLGSISTSVGIGNTAPHAKLHITGGKVYIDGSGHGVILKSIGGSCFELTVTNAGALTVAPVVCP